MLVISYFFQTSMKNNGIFFDVPMESFRSAGIYDLVGLYILSKLGKVFRKCDLYKDDGLGFISLERPVVYVKG